MDSHWRGLISKGMLATLFLTTLLSIGLAWSLFWAQPESDEGRFWLVEWRPVLLRNVWTQTPGLSTEALLSRLEAGENIWLVDVREVDEQLVSLMPGAMTEAQFERRLQMEEPGLIVAYCTIGIRSGEWVDKALARDLPVRNLNGGLLGWVHKGGTLVDQGRPTQRIHVYSEYWNLAPSNFVAVW